MSVHALVGEGTFQWLRIEFDCFLIANPNMSKLGCFLFCADEHCTELTDNMISQKNLVHSVFTNWLLSFQSMIHKQFLDCSIHNLLMALLNRVKLGRLPQVAVCSAATKSSVVFTLKSLLGEDTLTSLDCFLAGDDVKEKKPSPLIYQVAAKTLGVDPKDCLVVEDSMIGLEAAVGAGMRCLITPTGSTSGQPFPGAELVVPSLDGPPKIKIEDFC